MIYEISLFLKPSPVALRLCPQSVLLDSRELFLFTMKPGAYRHLERALAMLTEGAICPQEFIVALGPGIYEARLDNPNLVIERTAPDEEQVA